MYGVIDIGSNTIRLVIYKIENRKIKPLLNKKQAAGLAGYISKSNRMKKSGIAKAIAVLCEFKEIIDNMNLQEVFLFATASLRNIENTDEVLMAIKASSGFDVRVLTGDEEAVFDYYGALQSTEMNNGLLVDIGGGSTELVFYKEKEVILTESLPMGSLNLYNRYVENIIPTAGEMAAIENEVVRQLKAVRLPDCDLSFRQICGVGGTARATASLLQEMNGWETKNAEYACSQLYNLLAMVSKDPKELTRQLLKTAPDRIHTLLPGVVVLKTIAAYYGSQTIITSHYGVREGYLYYLLGERGESLA